MTMTNVDPNTSMQPAAEAPPKTLKEFLNSPKIKAELARVATKAMQPDDLINLTLIAASRNPDIFKCTAQSIVKALLDAAALGIKPGGLMGRGYLVPRRNNMIDAHELSFDPGWRGLVDIARRSGLIRRLEAHVAYEAEEFEVLRTPFTTIRHVPKGDLKEADTAPGKVRAAYAIAELTDGSTQIEVVWKRDLDKIRLLGAKNGPWAKWYEEMSRKTAVRRLCKYLPFDPLLDQALNASDDADAIDVDGDGQDLVGTPPPAGLAEQSASLADKVRARAAAMQPQADPDTGELPMTDEEKAAALDAEA